jgi:AcrR family transcriptional regulator
LSYTGIDTVRCRNLDRSGTSFQNYTESFSGNQEEVAVTETKPTDTAATDRGEGAPRRMRADAIRNIDSLLEAAKAVFASSGVDAPAKEISDLAGVGVGTLYRHFPQRSDLVRAVFQREVDACADAGPALSAAHEPGEAVTRWLQRFTDFVATKRGLAAALHSGDPAFDALPAYFTGRLGPTLQALLDAGAVSGQIRPDIDAEELLIAVSRLSTPGPRSTGGEQSQRMVALLIDGLRYGAADRSSQ